jgi:hypothetical protein
MRRSAFIFLSVVLFLILVTSFWVFSGYSSYNALFNEKMKFTVNVRMGNTTVEVCSSSVGDPLAAINSTLYQKYSRVTIILGTGDTKDYCDRTGKCQFRTLAASSVSCLIGKLRGAYYYETAREMGYNDSSARRFALEHVSSEVSPRWLSTWDKIEIGRGRIGNDKHLLIILRGPLDGAEENRVYSPRRGVLVIEALDERTLYEEALLLQGITGVGCST